MSDPVSDAREEINRKANDLFGTAMQLLQELVFSAQEDVTNMDDAPAPSKDAALGRVIQLSIAIALLSGMRAMATSQSTLLAELAAIRVLYQGDRELKAALVRRREN